MNLQRLRYLQLIVVKGSFAAAAQEAGVSQPAVTQAIQALEREWGVALFERSGRQKVPTRAALLAVQRAAGLLDPLEQLARFGPERQPPSALPAVLRVGMAPAAALFYGPVLQSTWQDCAPDGLLQIQNGMAADLLAAFQREELDLVIAPRPRGVELAGVRRQLLHRSLLKICARAGHPLGCATSLEQLRDAAWAVAGRAGTPSNAVEEAHRVRRLPPPRIAVQCADYNMLLHLVAHSELLCVLPHPALLEGREELAVQFIEVKEGLPRYEVFLYWRAARTPQGQAALDRVVEAVIHSAATLSRQGGG